MGVDAIYCAKIFYTLEALKLIVETECEFGKKSHERLLADIMDYRHRYIGKLKIALYDYSAMTAFGEMRHAIDKSTHYNPSVPHNTNRDRSYQTSRQYNPTSVLIAGEKLFSQRWGGSFGGKKWAFICNRVLLKDTIPDDIYCDMCFSLSHNCSPYLNKSDSGIFTINDVGKYKRLLDLKFDSVNPKKLIRELIASCGRELRALTKRAMILGFLSTHWTTRHRIEKKELHDIMGNRAEEFILHYRGVNWGGIWLETTPIKHKHQTYDDPFSALEGNIGCKDEVKEGEVLEVKCDYNYGVKQLKKGMIAKVVSVPRYSHSIEVVFVDNVDGHDLDGKCKDGYGLRLNYKIFKKHTA